MLSMRCGRREVAALFGAKGVDPCSNQAAPSFPLLLLQELFTPAPGGDGGVQGDGYAAPVGGNTFSMNHDNSVVFMTTLLS